MTEAEWLICDSVDLLFAQPRARSSARVLRLFACGCCRLLWDNLSEDVWRNAVHTAEKYAEGEATLEQLAAARAAFADPYPRWGVVKAALFACYTDASPSNSRNAAHEFTRHQAPHPDLGPRLANLFRDIFANPYSRASYTRSTETPTVLSLAIAAYEERSLPSGELDPLRLTILADALEDAGCSDAALLSHLRSPGPHVRGCWAIDLVLGKN